MNESIRSLMVAEVTGPSRRIEVRDGTIDSQELFQGDREVRIVHGDQTYRLRLTGLNKLILTK